MPANGEKDNQLMDSEKQLLTRENQETFENLPISVSLQLLSLMKKVVSKEVNPQTVNSACNCASEIHKILKLSAELEK